MFTGTSPGLDDKSSWYRCYVLVLLLVISIHNLSTRNLPSYLVTVQVPGCEALCAGVVSEPLCDTKKWNAVDQSTKATGPAYEACQICRAHGGPNGGLQDSTLLDTASSVPLLSDPAQAQILTLDKKTKDGNYYNMADGACMHDWEYGLLIGYGFALAFGVGSILAGWSCDRRGRVDVACISLAAWSVATSMQATAHDFWSLLACRSIVGLSQAFAMPASISIVYDIFASKRDRQNMAMAVLSVGFYLGSGCASFSIWFAELLGWRWAVLLAGVSGVAIAILLHLTVKEPERTEFSAPCSLAGVREEVFVKSRVARWCLLAASAKMLSAYVLGTFLPIWYARKGLPGYSNTSYAGYNALIIAVGGLLSTVVGSVVGGYWGQHDSRAPCWMGLVGAILSIPLIFLVVYIPSFVGSMICFFALILVSECWFAPTIALVQRSVRQSHRRQAIPMFLIATTMGANLGPALVGFSDPGHDGVGLHIALVVVIANIVAAVAFLFTAREITIDPIAAGVDQDVADLPKSVSGVLHWLAPF